MAKAGVKRVNLALQGGGAWTEINYEDIGKRSSINIRELYSGGLTEHTPKLATS